MVKALRPLNPSVMMSVLAVDAMYFRSAEASLLAAKDCQKNVAKEAQRVEELQQQIDVLNQRLERLRHGDPNDWGYSDDDDDDDASRRKNEGKIFSKLEQLCIRADGEEYRLGEAYGPM